MSAVLQELRVAGAAIQYFTRVPMPARVGHDASVLADCARHLPLVGIFVGTAVAAVFALLHLVLPALLAVVLCTAAGIALTGALHEDGLADTCDGLGGGGDRDRILAIMKDPHLGTFGVLGLVTTLLAKVAALDALASEHGTIVVALIAAHSASRLVSFAIMYALPYARNDSTSRSRAVGCPGSAASLAWALATGCGPSLLLGTAALPALACACVAGLLAARTFERRIGGYTGDCLGAAQQWSELAFYVGLVAWHSS